MCGNVDIDECATNMAKCDTHASCSNTAGSFTCTCNEGYSGNGLTCEGMSAAEAVITCRVGYCVTVLRVTIYLYLVCTIEHCPIPL